MPGGIFVLQSYGSGNQKFSGNPQTTFFRKLFKRFTHFAQEPIISTLNGPQQLNLQNKITLKTTIKRNADLLRAPFLLIDIPDIYAKVDDDGSGYEFRWIDNLPNILIDNVELFIGGNKIDSFNGLYTYLYKKTSLDVDRQDIYDDITGNTNNSTDPANGYLGDASGRYPFVVKDLSNSNATLNPSIRGYTMHIPLPFWFSDDPGQALPLISLQGHEVEIFITLNPIIHLYQTRRINTTTWTKPSADDDTNIRFFLTSYNGNTTLETWNCNPRLLNHYIYLADDERKEMAIKQHEYLIKQRNHFEDFTPNSTTLDLKQHNLISRILFTIRRTDFINNNDHTNLLNWSNYNYEPKNTLITPQFTNINNTGTQNNSYKRNILNHARIKVNGNEIFETQNPIYYNAIQPYLNTKIINTPGIYQYSFALNPNEYQPSGILNVSRVRDFEIELDLDNIETTTIFDEELEQHISTYSYQYKIDVFTETYNFLKIASGLGGLMYAR
jgi:hypothetical protein